jgi:hypothetical protein
MYVVAAILQVALSLGNLGEPEAHAADPLPYTVRTQPYSGFDTYAHGDVRTVGMGGATAGLGDTFLAATFNPAGLAMTMNGGDTNVTATTVHDQNVQNYGYGINTSNIGFALSLYPWAFSLGDVPTGREGQDYLLPSTASAPFAGQPATLLVQAHEYRFALARIFFDNHLSVAGSLNIGQAEEEASSIVGASSAWDDNRHATAIGATFGGMVRLPERVFVGFSYSLPMRYHLSGPSPELPGFFQDMESPSRGEFSVGWIPNRFLRGDVGFSIFGTTNDGVALLGNQQSLVGQSVTFQPKLGLAYIFMDFHHVLGTLFGGSYFEYSRILNEPGRFHRTGGVEVKYSIATIGLGFDNAPRYQNFLYSVGIDAGLVLQYLNLMPTLWRPDPRGFFPNPFIRSDEGLARPIVENWEPRGPDLNPIDVIKDLPKNAADEVERLKKGYSDEHGGH